MKAKKPACKHKNLKVAHEGTPRQDVRCGDCGYRWAIGSRDPRIVRFMATQTTAT